MVADFHPNGDIIKVEIKDLIQQEAEGEDGLFIDDRPADVEEFKRVIGEGNIDLRRDRLTTYVKLLDAITERRDTQLLWTVKLLQKYSPEVGINDSDFRVSIAADFVALVDAEPNGLHIDPVIEESAGEGEGELPPTAEQILDKIREAVGEEGMANYRVEAKDNRGFIVHSRTAQERPFDVNGDGRASPIDALIIINGLNAEGTQQLALWPSASELRTDVSLDGFRSPIDVLLIINFLNNSASTPAGEGEGYATSTPTVFFLPERPASYGSTNFASTATTSQLARDNADKEAELRCAIHDAVFASENPTGSEADHFHSADHYEWVVDQLLEDYLAESALAG